MFHASLELSPYEVYFLSQRTRSLREGFLQHLRAFNGHQSSEDKINSILHSEKRQSRQFRNAESTNQAGIKQQRFKLLLYEGYTKYTAAS